MSSYLHIYCQACDRIGSIVGEMAQTRNVVGEDSKYYPDHYRCGSCQAPGAHAVELTNTPTNGYFLSVEEFLAVQYNLGVPSEHLATVPILTELLTNAQIAKISAEPIANTNQCVLNSITLVDGTVLYLSASSHGATVYRIKKPFSYTEKALCPQQ